MKIIYNRFIPFKGFSAIDLIGIMAVIMMSCVNELLDSFEEGNKCDWADITAGALGAWAMCVYYYIV